MIWIKTLKMSTNEHLAGASFNQRRRLFTVLVFAAIALQCISQTCAQVPASHLVPPPPPPPTPPSPSSPALPIPQALVHSRPHDYSKRFEAQPIPLQRDVPTDYIDGTQNGLMTRLARWFGFAEGPQEQQLAAATLKHPAYSYPKPSEQLAYNNKAPCNLCNKYPWIPMMPLSVQYPPNQQQHQSYQQHQWQQQLQAQASKQLPAFLPVNTLTAAQQSAVKQRAVHLNFPIPYAGDHSKLKSKHPSYSVVQQPSASFNALPTAFNAKRFHSTTSTFVPFTAQQLPTTEPAHFAENIGAHSVAQPEPIIPTQIPPTVPFASNSNVEIIKSHQLTDFVSSVEYPATFVNSQSIDLGSVQNTQLMPENHKPEPEVSLNTAKYKNGFLKPHVGNHIPASQLLTEPGNLSLNSQSASAATPATFLAPTTYSPTHNSYAPFNHKPEPEQGANYNSDPYSSADNFPSASSHSKHNSFHLQSNDIYTTTESPLETTTQTGYLTITGKPQISSPSPPPSPSSSSSFEFLPSLQVIAGQGSLRYPTKDRGTPKGLLNAPLQYAGTARPFTRDPSELDYRLGGKLNVHNPQQQQQEQQQQQQVFANHASNVSPLPWLPTVTPPPTFSVSSAIPTPTSTYGAIDASGQYAGMSPPAGKNVKQIIVPYSTKSRPRPFEPAPNAIDSTANGFGKWHKPHSQHSVDPHEQQESKVVISTATELPKTNRPATTKYVTKVLAANLRELLRREQALKNRTNPATGVDLRKLQENIDDWTEQEYTSLSHRPSTPTIRGRSKHIPAEYLTTTTTPAPFAANLFKTTRIFDDSTAALSASINNLESLKTAERGSKRFEYPPIEENFINDFERVVTKATTTTKTDAITAATTTTKASATAATWPSISHDRYTTPIYIRPLPTQPPPEVLWQKAKVLISPDTKEKLYVVTPQPRFFPQRLVATTTTTTPQPLLRGVGRDQKSPRFLVRPTPGNSTSNTTTNSRSVFYSPEPFGLPGLSAYVPAGPVEIIDGNSKVVTIVTPSSEPLTESEDAIPKDIGRSTRTNYVTIHRNNPKPTMSPSPR